MSNTAITFITYIDTMQEKIKSVYEEMHTASTPAEVVDHLDDIKNIVASLDKYTMLNLNTASQLLYEFRAKINTLHSIRNVLLDRISKKRSSCVQTNVSSSFYNEDELISNIGIAMVTTTKEPIRLKHITIELLNDPKDYSCMALTKRFESEIALLEIVNSCLSAEFTRILQILNDIRNHNLEMKTQFTDIQKIEELCNNSESANEFIKQIDTALFNDMCNLDIVRSMITKMHQICIALTENYELYSKVIDSYTALTMEAFFDKDAPYEIC